MTEAAIDIGEELLKHDRGRPAASNPATMEALGAADLITRQTAREMAEAARFRNVLSHTYGVDIDHDVVYDALSDLERYRAFVVEVRDYLDEIGAIEGTE